MSYSLAMAEPAAASSTNVVLVERAGTCATVVLNRPEKLNALNAEMWRRVGEAFGELGRASCRERVCWIV